MKHILLLWFLVCGHRYMCVYIVMFWILTLGLVFLVCVHVKSGEGDGLCVFVFAKAPADAPAPVLERRASSHDPLTQHLLSSPPLPDSRKREKLNAHPKQCGKNLKLCFSSP